MKEAFDKITDGERMLRSIGDRLSHLAEAFDTTGNNATAEKLFLICRDVNTARNLVEQGRGEVMDDVFRASVQASDNMIRAALAVANRSAVQT